MDEETFDALERLEGRIEGLHQAIYGLIHVLTEHDSDLLQNIGTQLFGTFVDASDKNPHEAAQDELRRLGNALTGLKEWRAERDS